MSLISKWYLCTTKSLLLRKQENCVEMHFEWKTTSEVNIPRNRNQSLHSRQKTNKGIIQIIVLLGFRPWLFDQIIWYRNCYLPTKYLPPLEEIFSKKVLCFEHFIIQFKSNIIDPHKSLSDLVILYHSSLFYPKSIRWPEPFGFYYV